MKKNVIFTGLVLLSTLFFGFKSSGQNTNDKQSKDSISIDNQQTGAVTTRGVQQDDFLDGRDKTKYKVVKIGKQVWFAENLRFKSPKSFCYDKKEDTCKIYGRMYNYEEATKVCPAGWRLPTEADWTTLINGAGGFGSYKELCSPLQGGTNETGFSALPGGLIRSGEFSGINFFCNFWAAENKTCFLATFIEQISIGAASDNSDEGAYIRCIKNDK